ncbi:hypothetical protein [Bradyrhizobium neotropicale]|uniref:hypothetical protein n=1 Tax=Bradyrhizobium neotropicale TaxID=1497615 RepID=UPI001AD75212|nr:hypothetical protein [Bradyrhizobium neotropicale]MBO4228356.1 hypothetical protein [Bradyrhizobium neotropicale]
MNDGALSAHDLVVLRQWEASQRGALSTWTIFDHPRDFPNEFVARRFESDKTNPEPAPTMDLIAAHELEELRECFRFAGLTPLGRMDGDQPQIVEAWI